MRKIEIIKGKEITSDKKKRLKEITFEALQNSILKKKFKCWHNITNEVLVLGEDWYLIYDEDDKISILYWVAIDNPETKLCQSVEMITVLKELLLKYQDKTFYGNLRHITSYMIYSKMLKEGYLNETYHTVDVLHAPLSIDLRLEFLFSAESDSKAAFEEYLNSDEGQDNLDYLNYVYHKLNFQVTTTFVEKYDTKEKKYIF